MGGASRPWTAQGNRRDAGARSSLRVAGIDRQHLGAWSRGSRKATSGMRVLARYQSSDAVRRGESRATGPSEGVRGARTESVTDTARGSRSRTKVLDWPVRCQTSLDSRSIRSSPGGSRGVLAQQVNGSRDRKVAGHEAPGRTKSIGGAWWGPRETSENGLLRERLVQSEDAAGQAMR